MLYSLYTYLIVLLGDSFDVLSHIIQANFRVASLAIWQPYDCLHNSKSALINIGNYIIIYDIIYN